MPKKGACFVIQAFGRKTDLRTGRTLNLDASYDVIKEAAEESGFQCFRADEIVYSGIIDQRVYEWLYGADLVIADLSTYSLNAAYELGLRFALRRRGTIIVAEDQFRNVFNVDRLAMLSYKHLGDGLERSEAERFKNALKSRIQSAVNDPADDSPVYRLLPLQPPSARAPIPDLIPAEPEAPEPATGTGMQLERSAKSLLDNGRAAMYHSSFIAAKIYFRAVHGYRPNDESLVQELAAATFKARLPTPRAALEEARTLLEVLNPRISNNPETLRLWATVHRRLWELTGDAPHLFEAATTLERAFHVTLDQELANDLAYVLNLRADVSAKAGDRAEAIADFVLARRMRRSSIKFGERALQTVTPPGLHRYWRLAAMWEAAVGLEDPGAAEMWREQATASTQASWRLTVTQGRIDRLQPLIKASPLRDRGSR